tara:strand:- start:2453 stop:3604 length:1152 start_codon:yes stop_codon:yes gene_type:complete
MKKLTTLPHIIFISLIFIQCQQTSPSVKEVRWSEERAWQWHKEYGWMIGSNFNPSTSINQLEFWQEDTYDPETIERELEWSAELGMNIHRVYLHNLLWDQDSLGFMKRIENYLEISETKGIKTLFVLLDDCWHPAPKLGKQPEPMPFVHNSWWVQAPGSAILGDSSRHHEVKNYIKGVISHFAEDERVIGWDIYNEPGNVAPTQKGHNEFAIKGDKDIYTLSLIRKAFKWAREAKPSQPLTSSIWKTWEKDEDWSKLDNLSDLSRFIVSNSDIISFHTYGDIKEMKLRVDQLEIYNRPIMCTEYLARGQGSTFQAMLPLLKEKKIAAINWGFVAGKTNTIFPWSSWDIDFTAPPEIWHHDIYMPDKTPYDQEEIDFIKEITSK